MASMAESKISNAVQADGVIKRVPYGLSNQIPITNYQAFEEVLVQRTERRHTIFTSYCKAFTLVKSSVSPTFRLFSSTNADHS